MESGIYVIRNIINDKVYVGSAKNFEKRKSVHWKLLEDKKHWNIKLSRSVNKHGLENFIFEIIEHVSYEKDVIIERENYYIQQLNSKVNGYNIADASFGDNLTHHPHKDQICKNISNGLYEYYSKTTEEERKTKYGLNGPKNGMYGKQHSSKTKEKISQANRGKPSYRKGKTFEELFEKDMADKLKQKLSYDAKQRTGDSNGMYGKIHSQKTKDKISKANSGNIPANKTYFIIDGKEYFGLKEAEEKTGIKGSTISFRCKSKNIKFIDTYRKDKPKKMINGKIEI